MKVKIYIEGSGPGKDQQIECRRGFRRLIEKAGLKKMPATSACGSRNDAFKDFENAVKTREPDEYPMLLVDSEDLIDTNVTIWSHLKKRDNWKRPPHVSEDQAQLMATCMETWIMADRAALREFFGAELLEKALLPEYDLEQYDRHRVQDVLERATHKCGEKKAYKKGKRSFQVLETLNPATLQQHLPYFKRFIETLKTLLR